LSLSLPNFFVAQRSAAAAGREFDAVGPIEAGDVSCSTRSRDGQERQAEAGGQCGYFYTLKYEGSDFTAWTCSTCPQQHRRTSRGAAAPQIWAVQLFGQ